MSMRCKGNHANTITSDGRIASEVDEEFVGKRKRDGWRKKRSHAKEERSYKKERLRDRKQRE